MNFGRVCRTVARLRATQVVWQLLTRVHKPRFRAAVAPTAYMQVRTEPVPKPQSLGSGDCFAFLNISRRFDDWNDVSNGMLWAYNLNYMDWLNQPGLTASEGLRWIDRFIADLPGNWVGTDPYPTALRVINWIKFFCRFPAEATRPRLDSLYSQVLHLERRLERHLLGNHLLEDTFALFIAANVFCDKRLLRRATGLLLRQLREQVLPDGAHYEQSPMYHCILLDRLLDCINFDRGDVSELRAVASRMLGHLESVCWADGSLPMLNDSAEGIAPVPAEIFAYARRLGLEWQPVAMRECGYRKLRSSRVEAIVDVGGITASYQPGHSHADALNYELKLNGRPVVVDTGISTYEKNARRQYERSTAAHNTVTLTVGGRDSSEVWGGFRVGRRARVVVDDESPRSVSAHHDGFGRNARHGRTFELTVDGVRIADRLPAGVAGVSRMHFAPGVEIITATESEIITSDARITVRGADCIRVGECAVATQYNRLFPSVLAEIYFHGEMDYEVSSI